MNERNIGRKRRRRMGRKIGEDKNRRDEYNIRYNSSNI
jgi:hypothetical protein